MSRVSYPSLEHVAIDARPFPRELLAGAESGLVLFAAAFLGVNDAIHFAEAGVRDVTLVDVDGRRLDEMRNLYRDPSWYFIEADAFEYAKTAFELDLFWDVVSVDTFTGSATNRSLDDLGQWTAIARRAVTITATREAEFDLPRHWRYRRHWRSPEVCWLVLERD